MRTYRITRRRVITLHTIDSITHSLLGRFPSRVSPKLKRGYTQRTRWLPQKASIVVCAYFSPFCRENQVHTINTTVTHPTGGVGCVIMRVLRCQVYGANPVK